MIKDILEKIKDKFSKIKNKKVVGIVIILIIIVLILLIVSLVNRDGFVAIFNETDATRFEREYERLNDEIAMDEMKYPEVNIPSNNIVKYSNVEEILEIFNSRGDAVVYFGYSTCLYCRSAVQVLIDTSQKTKLDVIHYVDIEEVWGVKELNEQNEVVTKQEGNEKYYELLEVLGDELAIDYVLEDDAGNEIKTDTKTLEIPLVLFITNGEISGYNKGTLVSQEDPFTKLNEEQVLGLSKIYQSGINDVVDSRQNKGLIK